MMTDDQCDHHVGGEHDHHVGGEHFNQMITMLMANMITMLVANTHLMWPRHAAYARGNATRGSDLMEVIAPTCSPPESAGR
jgi:hypothetical protein